MALQRTSRSTSSHFVSIERAILETLSYSDIFDFPLRIEELHRYLPVPVIPSDLASTLNKRCKHIGMCDGYYFLAGHESLVPLRKKRNAASRQLYRRAIQIGRFLGTLPFIRMVGLTGSLALLNCENSADIDYMLIASHERVWLARVFALLLGRVFAFRGNNLCPNLIVSEQYLEWKQRDIYSAHELCQMVPVYGREVYSRLRRVNSWTNIFLPNATNSPTSPLDNVTSDLSLVQNIFEFPLRGLVGDRLEAWEMNRKINRFTKQSGYGVETLFSANICQGNFNHHGLQTTEAYQQRMAKLDLIMKTE